MAITNKQNDIVAELERRIDSGFYEEKLPKGLDLAAEFAVNSKTMNKAIAQLVEKGLVYRKTGLGTFIVKEAGKLEDLLIELLFVGSSEMASHPFYSEMWSGILEGLKDTGLKLVLTMMEEDETHGGLKHVHKDFVPSAGKILIGTCNEEQIKRLRREKVPFVLAGAKSGDSEVVSVYTDTTEAIKDAVEYLHRNVTTEIAYIGMTQDYGEYLLDLEKFYAYLAAVQKRGKFDSDLIEDTPPLLSLGYKSMKNILRRRKPGAVLVAYDVLVPGVYKAIEEAGLSIPQDISVIGVDGLNPNVTPAITSIPVDRFEMGRNVGTLIVDMIRNPGKNKYSTLVMTSEFNPEQGGSIRR